MSTPFINFGGMGPRFLCRVRVLVLAVLYDHRAVLPGSSPKDPDPPARIGRRMLYCGAGTEYPRSKPQAADYPSYR